jgi:hypothetical protein
MALPSQILRLLYVLAYDHVFPLSASKKAAATKNRALHSRSKVLLGLNHEGFEVLLALLPPRTPVFTINPASPYVRWSIVTDLENAQALHTKVKCLVTQSQVPTDRGFYVGAWRLVHLLR